MQNQLPCDTNAKTFILKSNKLKFFIEGDLGHFNEGPGHLFEGGH